MRIRTVKPELDLPSGRCPKNGPEAEMHDIAQQLGYKVTKQGWPDFFCWSDEAQQIMVVEVKRKRSHKLSKYQNLVMKYLKSYGVPCWKYTPDGNLEPI